MRDIDIRKSLRAYLSKLHRSQDDLLIVDELRMSQGVARVDMAVFNASLSGFEIKSDRDTLTRLPSQLGVYCEVCDFVTLVVAEKHVSKVRRQIPKWCGIMVATRGSGCDVQLYDVKAARINPSVDSYKRAQLLWKSEALDLLKSRGLLNGRRSLPRYKLWHTLATLLDSDDLNRSIIETIKARGDWRVGQGRNRSRTAMC